MSESPLAIGLVLDAPLIGVLKRWPHRLHAVEMEGVIDGVWGRGTFESVCGVRGLRLLGQEVEGQTIAVTWPPRIKGMPDGWVRCGECFAGTNKKRPRSGWRQEVQK